MNFYTIQKTYLPTTLLFFTLFFASFAFAQPSKPTLVLVEDTGTDASDNKSNNSAITISDLTENNSWSISTDSGITWIMGDEVGSSGTATFDTFYLISGMMMGIPTLSVASKQNQTSLGNTSQSYYSANRTGHTFFFDVTTPAANTQKQILFFSGQSRGITIFLEGTSLKCSVGTDNNDSDLTLENAVTANTRYWIVVELGENNSLSYYIAEKSSDDPTSFTGFTALSNLWTGNWSDFGNGAWGESIWTPQGTGSYHDFSGTFHRGQFFQDMSFVDLWKTDGTATTSVTVRHIDASDDSSTTDSDEFTFTRDNVEPTFTSGETASDIAENSGAGQVIYTAAADGNGDYTLGGDDMSHFTIDGSSGEVTLTADPDYETKNSYRFTVSQDDDAGNTGTQAVTLSITNVNEAPTFTSEATFSIRENWLVNTVAFAVTATDDEGDTITYALTNDTFEIDSSTGKVTLLQALDYESGTTSYTLTVSVSDNGVPANTVNQSITVTVIDIEDETPPAAPTIALENDTGSNSSDGVTNDPEVVVSGLESNSTYDVSTDGGTTWHTSVGTNSANTFDISYFLSRTIIGNPTASATAAGAQSSLTSHALATQDNVFIFDVTTPTTLSGDKEVLFESGGTGTGIVIYVKDSALKCTIGDANAESILASSSVLSANTRYAIAVELTEAKDLRFYVAEKEANSWPAFGSPVAQQLSAWSSSNWDGGDDGGWGQVGGNSAQGEETGSYSSFTGTFHAGYFYANKSFLSVWSHEGSSAASITVRQKDASQNVSEASSVLSVTYDNVAPAFTSGQTASAINENSGAGQEIYTAASDDTGTGDYTLGGTDASLLSIVGSTGVVTLTADPDYETKASYSFTVSRDDVAGNTGTHTVSLSITDLADNNPVFTSGTTATAAENQTSTSYTATATPDVSGATVTYSIAGGVDQALFELSGATLNFKVAPDYETPHGGANDDSNDYIVEISASDGTNTATQTVTVSVTDVDDTPPAKPTIVFTDDGDDVTDGITSDSNLTISGLEVGATLELSRDNGVNWITYGEVTANTITINGGQLPMPGTLDDSPTVIATELATTTNITSHAAELPDSFYFDITMPNPLTTSKEIIFETGGSGVGIAFFSQEAALMGSIYDNNDASDLTANGVFEAGKRYAILIEFLADHAVKYYVAEKLADALPANFGDTKATGIDILDGVSSSSHWAGSDNTGWGQVNNTAQGSDNNSPNTYVSFTGTFHEGRFYSGETFSDIWTDLDVSSPQTLVDDTTQANIISRQTDTAGNVSEISDPIMIQLTTLNVDTIVEEELFYTNPVTNTLELVSESPINGVSLYSLSGQKVLEVSPERSKVMLDISSLATGLYVMKITTQTSEKTVKLFKQ